MVNGINTILRRDFSDPKLQMLTVTKVELTSDYSYANVYWDTYNPSVRGDLKIAVGRISSKMRTKLASVLNVRHAPKITFIYDSQYEDEKNIMDLLQKS